MTQIRIPEPGSLQGRPGRIRLLSVLPQPHRRKRPAAGPHGSAFRSGHFLSCRPEELVAGTNEPKAAAPFEAEGR